MGTRDKQAPHKRQTTHGSNERSHLHRLLGGCPPTYANNSAKGSCQFLRTTFRDDGNHIGAGIRRPCRAFTEAANFAIRHSPPIRAWYEREKAHRVVALKAVGHMLARAAFHILRDHNAFDVYRAFG